MTNEEKDDILYVLRKVSIKLIETHALMKDGKFIVAYEKLGGVLKIVSDFGGKVENFDTCDTPPANNKNADISS